MTLRQWTHEDGRVCDQLTAGEWAWWPTDGDRSYTCPRLHGELAATASYDVPWADPWQDGTKPTSDWHNKPESESTLWGCAKPIYDSALMTLCQKNQDYGDRAILDSPGGALNGVVVRAHDKLERIVNLYQKDDAPAVNESLEDSFRDLLNYCAIALLLLDKKWPGQSTDTHSRDDA